MGIQGIGSGSGFSAAAMAQDIFKKLDTNGDGGIDKAEFQAAAKNTKGSGQDSDKMFNKIDTNGDGKIDKTENENALKQMGNGRPAQGKSGMSSGGKQKTTSSGGTSQTSSSKVYDKEDANEDGTVSPLEKIEYALKHPGEQIVGQLQSKDGESGGLVDIVA